MLATDLGGGSVWFGGSTEMGPVVHRYPVMSRAWEDNFFIKSGGFRASTLAQGGTVDFFSQALDC